MINVARRLYTFSNRTPLDALRPDTSHFPKKKPFPTRRRTSAKPLISRPILPQDRTTNDWATIAWPTNNQSRTPDGQFGPASQIMGWRDCWLLAALGAIANDNDGRRILTESIKKVTEDGIRGYSVTFKGSPEHSVFIPEQMLDDFVDKKGGDADTRLMELAAAIFFSVNDRFSSLYIASLVNRGLTQYQAEQCLSQFCDNNNVQDPKSYNPMRSGCYDAVGFFFFTGVYPDFLWVKDATIVQRSDIMAYLNRYATTDGDGVSIAYSGVINALGNTDSAIQLVGGWDTIRTEIAANGTVDAQAQAFLNALDRWLATPDATTWQVLQSAATNLKLQHYSPETFVAVLDKDQMASRPNHRAVLRSAVQAVLGGGLGYIGVPSVHSGTIEGINGAKNTFTYSEPKFPTMVHTGELSAFIRAVRNGHVTLTAFKPTTGQDEAESSHTGEQRGRRLLAFHQRAVNDGKIDAAEIGPLANLMAMDDGAFRHVYDSDHNGVIQGGELKAVQRRVDRWVNYLNLTPIW